MRFGMLWQLPNDQACFSDKVEAAAVYYEKKYGNRPTTCFINPAIYEANKDQAQPVGILIQPKQFIQKHTILLGVDNDHPGNTDQSKRGET